MKISKTVAMIGVAIALTTGVASAQPMKTTVWDIVQASSDHSTLEAAIICTGLEAALDGRGQRTLFAPTDVAFAGFGLNEGNICGAFTVAELTGILVNHVARGRRSDGQVTDGETIKMLSGGRFAIEIVMDPTLAVLVGGAKLDLAGVNVGNEGSAFEIDNGLIHFVGEGIVGLGIPAP